MQWKIFFVFLSLWLTFSLFILVFFSFTFQLLSIFFISDYFFLILSFSDGLLNMQWIQQRTFICIKAHFLRGGKGGCYKKDTHYGCRSFFFNHSIIKRETQYSYYSHYKDFFSLQRFLQKLIITTFSLARCAFTLIFSRHKICSNSLHSSCISTSSYQKRPRISCATCMIGCKNGIATITDDRIRLFL